MNYTGQIGIIFLTQP